MPGEPLCRAAEGVGAEQTEDRSIFRGVVGQSRRAVQVDVVYRLRTNTRRGKRTFHREPGPKTFGMRCGHMMRIAALAYAQEQHRIFLAALVDLFEQSKSRGLADRYAFARNI